MVDTGIYYRISRRHQIVFLVLSHLLKSSINTVILVPKLYIVNCLDMLKIPDNIRSKFKHHCFPAELILSVVYMKCRFSLSYRDLEELISMRDVSVDHATIQRWVYKFISLIADNVKKRRKRVHGSWRVDETYIKIKGKWCYLYRAVDKYGDTIDFLLRKNRNKAAARAFFKKAFRSSGHPHRIVMDKSGANKAAIDDINKEFDLDDQIEVLQVKYLNNILEQDHRFIKKRTNPMLGFKNFNSARKTICGIENIRIIQKGQIIDINNNHNTYQNFCSLMNNCA